jgi:hypothetical protein
MLDPEMRRRAFVAVGWAKFNGEPEFAPYLACVSNLYSRGDFTPLQEPADEFSLWARRLDVAADEGGYFHSEGQRLDEDEQASFIQRLGAPHATYIGPDALVEALIEKVREKADSLVGRGMLINVLPSRHHRRGRPRARGPLRATDAGQHVPIRALRAG